MCALQNMLDHMLSIHVRSRVFATLEDAAQFIKSVSMLYDAYVETKNINKLKVREPNHVMDNQMGTSYTAASRHCVQNTMPCPARQRLKDLCNSQQSQTADGKTVTEGLMWLATKNPPAMTLRLRVGAVPVLQSALSMITEAEQEAATKEADQAAGASAAQLASRQAQQQVGLVTSEQTAHVTSAMCMDMTSCGGRAMIQLPYIFTMRANDALICTRSVTCCSTVGSGD